jgi:hypothetical protein
MKLQRQYTDGACSHVRVVHTGTSPEQNFSTRLVDAGVAQGWVSVSGDRLLMKTDAAPLAYTVKRPPGYYCKSTDAPIPVSDAAWRILTRYAITDEARPEVLAWLAAQGKAADDYDLSLAWECVLDAAQHDAFKVGA